MMYKMFVLALGVAALSFAPALHAEAPPGAPFSTVDQPSSRIVPAQARRQMTCTDRDVVIEQLASRYGETRRGIGLAANNTVMEIFASDTGSWTITITLASGQTCLMASGEAYETLIDALPAAGKGT